MKVISDINDPRLVKALAHPLRVRILGILENRVASPSEIAEEISAPLGNVSYHVRMLAEFGLIRLVRRTPRRGAVEHHYEAVGRLRISDNAWAQVPLLVKEAIIGATLGQIGDYVNGAAAAGGFNRPDAHASRMPLVLDEQGMAELSRETTKLFERAQEIQRESHDRLLAADHEGELNAGLVMMLFEGDDFGSGERPVNTGAAARENGARRPVRLRQAVR